MLSNGPHANVGEILDVELERPRHRLELAEDAKYNHYRAEVVRFLHERHGEKKSKKSSDSNNESSLKLVG
jgi:nitrate/nitrite transport system ATP-binding protein